MESRRHPGRRRQRPAVQQQQSEEDAAQAGATEEILLALQLLVGGGAGLRHPLHGHAYARYTALRPRVCHACQGAILGPFSKACQCLSCGIVVHRACVMRVPKAPCGSYGGLRDPDGRRSLPLEAQEAAAAAAAAVVTEQETATKATARARARASPSPVQSLLRAAKPASVKIETADDEPGRQSGEDGKQGSESITGMESAGAAAAAMERRSVTYEALAMMGRLVGTMVGSSSSSSFSSSPPASASAGLAMPPPPPPGSPKEGSGDSGGFGFATLRSGARAIAGAYAGYTSRAQQEEEAEASATGLSHLQAARLMGLGRGLGGTRQPNNSAATAWSQLAQRMLREGAAGEGLLDFTAFVRHLEAAEAATTVFDEVGVSPSSISGSAGATEAESVVIETPSSGGSSHHHGSGKRGGLIADILRSQRTAPGFLWAACLGRFLRRHERPESEPEHADDEQTDEENDKALLPPAPASQDAAAIIHEVALVLVDFVPGLLTPSCHLALEAYEEAFGAVEGMVMTTLAPYVLAECKQRTAAQTAAVEGWYASRPPSRDEEEEEEGDHDAALEKAAAELRALAQECMGPHKVRRVLRCCLALGEGLQGSNRVMTADELLPALGKAVRRAAVPALPAHLAFVEETCDTGALLGAEGYALTSLQVVVSLIVQPSPSEGERGFAQGERSQPEEQDAAVALVDR